MPPLRRRGRRRIWNQKSRESPCFSLEILWRIAFGFVFLCGQKCFELSPFRSDSREHSVMNRRKNSFPAAARSCGEKPAVIHCHIKKDGCKTNHNTRQKSLSPESRGQRRLRKTLCIWDLAAENRQWIPKGEKHPAPMEGQNILPRPEKRTGKQKGLS